MGELHRWLDQKTEFLRQAAGEPELLRRAEEAGAALQRLEWALHRVPSPPLQETGVDPKPSGAEPAL